MGRGLKVAHPTPGTTGSAEPVPSGTRLLPFVVVAKVMSEGGGLSDEELEALYQELRTRGLGSGEYLCLADGRRSIIYDVKRSLGHLANTPLFDLSRGPPIGCTATDLSGNLQLVLPAKPDSFVAWWKTKRSLGMGKPLWGKYGSSSPINKQIRAAQRARKDRSPIINQRCQSKKVQLARARVAKAQKREDSQALAAMHL